MARIFGSSELQTYKVIAHRKMAKALQIRIAHLALWRWTFSGNSGECPCWTVGFVRRWRGGITVTAVCPMTNPECTFFQTTLTEVECMWQEENGNRVKPLFSESKLARDVAFFSLAPSSHLPLLGHAIPFAHAGQTSFQVEASIISKDS